jgi:hypothetical protein
MNNLEVSSWPDAAVTIAIVLVVGFLVAKLLDIIGKALNK